MANEVGFGGGGGVQPWSGVVPRGIQQAMYPWQYEPGGIPPVARDVSLAYPLTTQGLERLSNVPVVFRDTPLSVYEPKVPNPPPGMNQMRGTVALGNSWTPNIAMHEYLHAYDDTYGLPGPQWMRSWAAQPIVQQIQETNPQFGRAGGPEDILHQTSPVEWFAQIPTSEGPYGLLSIPDRLRPLYSDLIDFSRAPNPSWQYWGPEETPQGRQEMLRGWYRPSRWQDESGEYDWTYSPPYNPESYQPLQDLVWKMNERFGYAPTMPITELVRRTGGLGR